MRHLFEMDLAHWSTTTKHKRSYCNNIIHTNTSKSLPSAMGVNQEHFCFSFIFSQPTSKPQLLLILFILILSPLTLDLLCILSQGNI